MAISHDGRYLAVGTSNGDGLLWNIEADSPTYRQVLRRFEGHIGWVNFAQFSPDDHYILFSSLDFFGDSGGGSLILWDVQTGEQVQSYTGFHWFPQAMAFSPDGQLLLFGTQGSPLHPDYEGGSVGDLLLYDVLSGEVLRRFDLTLDVSGAAFSTDGTRFLTGSSFGNRVVLWDTASLAPIMEMEYGWVNDVGFGPNEQTVLATSGQGNDVVMWDATTGEIVQRFVGNEGYLPLALSPDGYYVAAGSGDDTVPVIIIWDLETAQETRRLVGHDNYVWNLAYGPDGTTLYSTATDGTLREWRVGDESLDELLEWAEANRYITDFTCQQRVTYRIEPLCD